MTEHSRDEGVEREEANFYPVDGIRGHCVCGYYFNFISVEGEVTCPDCGTVYNVYVDSDVWQEAIIDRKV